MTNAAQVILRCLWWCAAAGLEDCTAGTTACVWAGGVLVVAVGGVRDAAPETEPMMITTIGMAMVIAFPTQPLGHRYLASAMYVTTAAAKSQSDSSIGKSTRVRHPHPLILELIQNGPGRFTPNLTTVPFAVVIRRWSAAAGLRRAVSSSAGDGPCFRKGAGAGGGSRPPLVEDATVSPR